MDMDKMKADLIRFINEVEDAELLEEIGLMIKERSESFYWNDLPTDVQNRVEEARTELKSGGGKPHEEVMTKYSQWL